MKRTPSISLTASTAVPTQLSTVSTAYTLAEGGKLCDIVPTLLEVMGLEQPAEMTGHSLLVRK